MAIESNYFDASQSKEEIIAQCPLLSVLLKFSGEQSKFTKAGEVEKDIPVNPLQQDFYIAFRKVEEAVDVLEDHNPEVPRVIDLIEQYIPEARNQGIFSNLDHQKDTLSPCYILFASLFYIGYELNTLETVDRFAIDVTNIVWQELQSDNKGKIKSMFFARGLMRQGAAHWQLLHSNLQSGEGHDKKRTDDLDIFRNFINTLVELDGLGNDTNGLEGYLNGFSGEE